MSRADFMKSFNVDQKLLEIIFTVSYRFWKNVSFKEVLLSHIGNLEQLLKDMTDVYEILHGKDKFCTESSLAHLSNKYAEIHTWHLLHKLT